MAIMGDALRQAFMPKFEYESLRDEEKAWKKIRKPLISLALTLISFSVLISTVISYRIVYMDDNLRRSFCRDLRIRPLSINFTSQVAGGVGDVESDLVAGAFALTDQETIDYYRMMISAVVFSASMVYLIAGLVVGYTSPARHGWLKVVENNYCASRRGGLRCLSILHIVFAITIGLLALFLGSTFLTHGSSCSLPLFWCYEITSWGLVVLHGASAFSLRRKADENDFASRNTGIEMLETHPIEVTPDVERRVNEGFKSWMGPSFLSSDDDDEEEEPDDYLEVPNVSRSNSARLRV